MWFAAGDCSKVVVFPVCSGYNKTILGCIIRSEYCHETRAQQAAGPPSSLFVRSRPLLADLEALVDFFRLRK